MMKKKRFKSGNIYESIAFGILIVISIVIMAVVIWINIKEWLR